MSDSKFEEDPVVDAMKDYVHDVFDEEPAEYTLAKLVNKTLDVKDACNGLMESCGLVVDYTGEIDWKGVKEASAANTETLLEKTLELYKACSDLLENFHTDEEIPTEADEHQANVDAIIFGISEITEACNRIARGVEETNLLMKRMISENVALHETELEGCKTYYEPAPVNGPLVSIKLRTDKGGKSKKVSCKSKKRK